MTTAHYTAILEQNQDISSLLAQNILDQDDDQERVYCVYMHTSPSGKSYVGQTNDYNRRSRHHNTKNGCPAFKAAIDKYGWDKFTHVVMADTLTLAEANFLEKHFIFSLNTLSPAGYNLKTGGLNSLHTEATKQKISDSNQGKYFSEEHKQNMRDNHADVSGEKNPCFGRVLSEDHLKKLRDANVGRAQTEEHKQKLSASRKGKKRSEETKQKMRDANAGKSLSEATKQKISDSKKGKPLTTEHKQKLSAIRKGKNCPKKPNKK
jgi:group I intron endonuclease